MNFPMRRIRKFFQLSWADKRLLIQSILLLVVATLGLRGLSLSDLQHLLLKLANGFPRFVPASPPSGQQISWSVRVASGLVPKATCLPRALAAQVLLIRHDYPADLKFGIAKNKDGKLEAHAWVTSGNRIIIGAVPESNRFVPLAPVEETA